ncbi:MAG TPA: endopeptidase La, partial [Candidatus Omnitrophica bacterium]|nr:endopeptidase La [Candidatus Omnitrophota bacterium]
MDEVGLAKIDLKIPTELPILPLRDTVVFPGMIAPITVGRPSSVKLIDDVSVGEKLFGMILQKEKEKEEPGFEDLYTVGTLSRVIKMFKMPTNTIQLLVQGLARIELRTVIQIQPYIKASIIPIVEQREEKTPEIEARMRNLISQFQKAVSLSPRIPEESYITAMNIEDTGRLADFIAANLPLSTKDKQEILGTPNPKERLEKAASFLSKELEVLELESRIQQETKSKLDKAQREYFLRQQLESIKKELGEKDEHAIEIKELKKKIEESGMSEEAEKEANRELDRLNKLPPQAAEYHVIRTYLDWLVSLPWKKSTQDRLDIERAAKILDEDHHDLEKVKDRIVEFLAVRKLKKN